MSKGRSMSKYHHETELDVTSDYGQGICYGPHYGGSIKVINESERLTVEFSPDNVIGETVACFNRELRKELARYGTVDDEGFKDAVYAGFCEYMERLFSGRMNR